MRKFLTVLLVLVSSLIFAGERKVYVIDIRQEINAASQRILMMGMREAQKLNADYIILNINTYGGAVDAADSMRTAILKSKIPFAAFINNQAASAGALISISCDSIYMSKGSSIGAATVVDQTGKVLPDKYQSFMRAMMRSTAEANGRDPKIAEAMVDPSVSIPGIIDSTKVLSFTREEAIKNNYCEGKAETIEEVASQFVGSLDYVIIKQRITFLDKLISFFLSPVVQGILIMMIIGGIYFEVQAPGFGFPSVIAITGAVLYFAPLYLEGLANYWEIILFFIGVALIILELFAFVGFGVAGILGIIILFAGLTFAMIDNDLLLKGDEINLMPIIKPLALVMVTGTSSLILSIYFASKIFGSSRFTKLALKTSLMESDGFVGVNTDYADLVGKMAIVMTDMKPSGKIEIDGKWYEASLEFGMVRKGGTVVVTRFEGGRLYCECLPQ
ncbi:MAG: NfeD family protein [Bacteroidales bacterium]